MEFKKIANLFDTGFDDKDLPRFVTIEWIEVYDRSEKNYNVNKEIRIKTPMLRSDLCDFSDAYIVVRGNITVTEPINAKQKDESVAFKNNAPLVNFISKINDKQIENVEDLDIVLPMYNLLEYSENYRKTTGSLWSYYRDEPVILFLLILNLLNTRQLLHEILIMLVMVKPVMMQTKLVKMKLKFLFH